MRRSWTGGGGMGGGGMGGGGMGGGGMGGCSMSSASAEPAARAATQARARELTRVDALAESAQRVAMRRVGITLTELRKATVALHEAEDEALEVRRHAAGQRH